MEHLPEEICIRIFEYLDFYDCMRINKLKPKNSDQILNSNSEALFNYSSQVQEKKVNNHIPKMSTIINLKYCIILRVNMQKLIQKYEFHDIIFNICDSLCSRQRFIVVYSNNSFFILYMKNNSKVFLIYEMIMSKTILYLMLGRRKYKRDYGILFKPNESITKREFIKRMFYL